MLLIPIKYLSLFSENCSVVSNSMNNISCNTYQLINFVYPYSVIHSVYTYRVTHFVQSCSPYPNRAIYIRDPIYHVPIIYYSQCC